MTYATPTTHPELYVNQTRTLRDGDGRDRVVTMGRIYWDCFDWLCQETFPAQKLIAIADEEAPTHGMTFEEYFPEGLACMRHYFDQRPELWNSNINRQAELAGYIGPVSKQQIDAIQEDQNNA